MKDLPSKWTDSHLFAQRLGCRCWKMSTFRRNKELATAAWHRQTAKRVMVWWQMDTFLIFFIKSPYKEIYRQGQKFRRMHLSVLPRAQACMSSGLSVTVPLGQGNLCTGFAQAYSLVNLWILHAKTSLTEQLSIWASLSVTKKTMWSGGIWGMR